MKKTFGIFLATFVLLCASESSFGQIPNGGFESWNGNEPNSWSTSNSPVGVTITSSTTVHGGSYAAKGMVVPIAGTAYVIQPVLQSATNARGFAFSQRPTAFTGYYEFFPVASSGDRFGINVALYKGGLGGTPVASAAAAMPTSVSSYAQFSVNFTYLTSDIPDTCIIQIQIVGPATGAQTPATAGSYFLIDDLAFTGTNGVAVAALQGPADFQLNQNYPNPFNPSTRIDYSLPSTGFTRLTVHNILGQEIATLVKGVQASGRHSITFNASDLPSGVYFSRLEHDGDVRTQRMILLK